MESESILYGDSKSIKLSKFACITEQKPATEPVESPLKSQSSMKPDTLGFSPGAVAERDELQLPSEKSRPLSPYPMYDDLKPPTSPIPTPNTANLFHNQRPATKPVESSLEPQSSMEPIAPASSPGTVEGKIEHELHPQKSRPLSPYPMKVSKYENLKPPSSPSPTPK
eukprot:Gb_17790 [translate_table: standard]